MLMGMNATETPNTAAEWADAIEAEQHGYDWDTYSESYSCGYAAGIPLSFEYTEEYPNKPEFVSADGRWRAVYDDYRGHWYGYDL
jgi:hypothetical protein